MNIIKNVTTIACGTALLAGLTFANMSFAFPECPLGTPDCDLGPKSGLIIPVASKHGTQYKCSIRSVEDAHKVNGEIYGADGFSYAAMEYLADTGGKDFILEGEFTSGNGKIVITNLSNYAAKASCSKTCSKGNCH